jgi:hypothetical protein
VTKAETPSDGTAQTAALSDSIKAVPPKSTAPSTPPPAGSTGESKVPPKKTAKKAAKKSAKKTTKKAVAKKPAAAVAPEARSAAQIQADIDAAQDRLASRVDELSDRLHPQTLAEDAVGNVKKIFVHEDGTPKAKPIAITAAGVTALLVLRKIFHRG